MREIFFKKGMMPRLYPGTLIRTLSDRWLQFITTKAAGNVFYGHYLIVDNNDRVAITASLSGLTEIADRNVKAVYRCQVPPDGVPKPLTQSMIKGIIKGAPKVEGVEVWYNPKHLPRRKMTVAEIEEKLGYGVEIISKES